jgi:hypothetical protein
VAGAGLFLLAAASWMLLGPAVGYTAAAAAIVLSLMILSLTGRRTARLWHLVGAYHGQTVTIYSSTDVRVFNQVTRALRRSTENKQRTRGTEDLAAA